MAGTTTVSATFSEPMAAASLTGSLTLTDTTTSGAVAGSLAYDGPSQTLTFTPSSALAAGHNFSATQGTAATDLAGNHLASAVTWTFSTAAGGDGTPPTVTLTSPADGDTLSGTSVSLTATANDNVAVDHVDFLVDSTVVGTDSSAPYAVTWDSTSVSDGSHTVTARAADPSLNTATDSHAVTVSNQPQQTGNLFSDGFESGDFAAWSSVNTGADGTATVQTGVVRSGTHAARFTESSTGSSFADVRKDLGSDQAELTISGDFRIAGEGSSSQNIPLFRLFDSGGTRRLSLYRQDGSGGLQVWDGSGYHSTTKNIALNTWAHLELHVIAGSGSGTATVEIRLDGVLVYQVTNATLGPVRTIQLGNETKKQPMDLFVDNVSVDGPGGTPPAPDTTITSGPSGTVTSSSATFTFTSTIVGSTFTCSLDGAAFSACASPVTYTGLGDGTHAFAVAATANSVTDPTPASAGWTVDTTPPTVTATNPTNGATNVAGTTTVSATFSEPMAAASLTGSLTLTDTTTSGAVAGSLAYDGPSQTLTFTPSSALAAGHNFSATQGTAATDLAGNHLASAVTWTFSTAANPAPDTTITSGPSGTVTSSSATFTFTSTIVGSTFTCSLDGAAFSACASPVTYTGLGDGTHAFAVAATANSVTDPTPASAGWTVDTTPPTVTATNPTNGATNVATSTALTASFGEPMASSTINGSSFSLTDTTISGAVPASVSYDGPTQTASLTPSAALAAGHTFAATVSTAATDLAGNHLVSNVTWTFSTASTPPPPPSLFSDDFESGNLSAWSSVNTGGDGTATAQSSLVKSGSYAGHFTESSGTGSVSNARATFASDQTELTITGDFRIAGEGTSSQNIPLFRLFDSGGARRLSLYRQDVSGGIYVWDATGYHATGVSVSMNTWLHVQLHVVAGNGSGIATVDLTLDGTVIYQTTSATLPPVRTVQIGNETSKQPMDLYVDNVVITGP